MNIIGSIIIGTNNERNAYFKPMYKDSTPITIGTITKNPLFIARKYELALFLSSFVVVLLISIVDIGKMAPCGIPKIIINKSIIKKFSEVNTPAIPIAVKRKDVSNGNKRFLNGLIVIDSLVKNETV